MLDSTKSRSNQILRNVAHYWVSPTPKPLFMQYWLCWFKPLWSLEPSMFRCSLQETHGGSVLYGNVYYCHIVSLIVNFFPLSSQFLGNTEVEAPKGTEVVKDAVRKLKVSQLQMGRLGLGWEAEEGEVSDTLTPSSPVTAKVPPA